MFKKTIKLLIFSLLALNIQAQDFIKSNKKGEVLIPLTGNYLQEKVNQKHNLARSSGGNLDTIQLPFFDDFSNTNVVPDQKKWCDRQVFINRDFSSNPITIGLATMDGLNDLGQAYSFVAPDVYGSCDSLTSQAIDLSDAALDSIYLSFYYQAGGLGERPDRGDSLVLYFKNDAGNWNSIWSVDGIIGVQKFEQVIFQINQMEYLHEGFQFRLVNYGNQTGSVDHWNLDYFRLDERRNQNDTSSVDVAYLKIPTSMLKTYHSMPWKHFLVDTTENIKDSLPVTIVNLDRNKRTPNYVYFSTDESNGMNLETQLAGQRDIDPFSMDSQTIFLNPRIPIFAANQKRFVMRHHYAISGQSDNASQNDTASNLQIFENYFAYDDGTAESAIGLNVSGGEIAYKFHPKKADSLRAIQIFFTQIKYNYEGQSVKLKVWKSIEEPNNNLRDSVIYEQNINIKYRDSINHFVTIPLDSVIAVEDSFYIGWEQNVNRLLHLGLDKNNDARKYRFQKTQGFWEQSTIKGAWMLRPVLSDSIIVGLGIAKNKAKLKSFKIFPNPAKNAFFVQHEFNPENHFLEIYDISGRLIQNYSLSKNQFEISQFDAGIYFILIKNKTTGNLVGREKLVKF